MMTTIKQNKSLITIAFITLVCIAPHILAAGSEIKWNDAQIDWQQYEEGMDEAYRSDKPVLLVIYTDWCPTCKKYGNVFRDQRVVAESAKFVMIRINKDQDKELSRKYGYDGVYIPRTIALYPNGRLINEIYRQKNYRYYIEPNADSLLGLMRNAFTKARN